MSETIKEDSIKLTWCAKHNNWWITNCPDCMTTQNLQWLLMELREKWCYEQAHGRAVFSLKLDDWVEICKKYEITEDWWELKDE